MQSSLASLEAKLDDMLVKNAPFQIPEAGRKWIATYAWIFTIVGVVLGAMAALTLFGILGIASVAIGGVVAATGGGIFLLFAWLALAVLVLQVALEAMAISPLKAMKKRGWDLIFYSVLISIVYNLFEVLRQFDSGFALFSLLWSMFISIAVLYVLFQVRGQFAGSKRAVEDKAAEAPKS